MESNTDDSIVMTIWKWTKINYVPLLTGIVVGFVIGCLA